MTKRISCSSWRAATCRPPRGALVSDTPLLIYNRPGTTHRDRFRGGRGWFLAISGGTGTEAAMLGKGVASLADVAQSAGLVDQAI